jgi:lipoprotein
MQKFKKIILLSLLSLPLLAACKAGNKDVIGTVYTFNYAQVKLSDGTIIEGEVDSWSRPPETDTIRVTFKDKGTYLTHGSNVTLYNKN